MLTIKNPRAQAFGILFLTLMFLCGCKPPGPRALLRGKRLIEQGKYAQAVSELKTATSLLATNAQAWNYLGLACQYAGQTSDAQHAYERALLLDHDLSEAHYNLGCLFLEINQTNAARNEFTAFTLRRANSVDGLVKLGIAQTRCRDWNGAEKTFHDALKVDSTNVEALNGLGIVRLQRGKPAESVDCFSKALSKNTNFTPALLNLAIVQQQYLKDRTAAISSYRKYISQTKDPGGVVSGIVRQLEAELVPTPRAETPAQANPPRIPAATPAAAITQPPPLVSNVAPVTKPVMTNPPIKLVAAPKPAVTNTQAPITNNVHASTVETVHLEPEPTYKIAQDVVAPVSAPTGPIVEPSTAAPPLIAKTSQPVPQQKRGLLQKINPMNLFKNDSKTGTKPLSSTESKSSESTGNALDAVNTSDKPRYTYRSPGQPLSGDRATASKYFSQGVQMQQARRLPEATQSYRQATQMDPAYYEAYYNLGLTSVEQGNLPAALDYYEMALAIQPDSLDARYNFALALRQANYPVDAVNEFERILIKHPDEARVHLALGNLYTQQFHQVNAARKHYVRVLELEPGNSQANAIRYWLTSNPP